MRQTNAPTQAQERYTWAESIVLFAKTPHIDTFKLILKQGKLTPQRAYLWVFFGSALLGVALASDNPVNILLVSMLIGLPIGEVNLASYQPDMLTIALSGITMGGMYGLIGFIMQTWTLQRIAQYFGANGAYRNMFILRGIYFPVLMTARALIIAMLGITSPVTNVLIFISLFLDMLLSSMALTASNETLSWGKSAMASSGMYLAMFLSLVALSLVGVAIA